MSPPLAKGTLCLSTPKHNGKSGTGVMTSTLSVLNLGSVASLLIATFYQGDPYTKHKL